MDNNVSKSKNNNQKINNSNSSKQPKLLSAMAITSLVLGGVALLLSFIPIVNNVSFFLVLLGIVFGIIGLVAILKKKKRNKIIVIIALCLNIFALVIVIASQNFYSNQLQTITNENQVTNNTNSESNQKSKQANVGETIHLSNGLDLCVNSVQGGLLNYDNSQVTQVNVTYVNNSNSELSFNTFDWKAEDTQGAQTNSTFYSKADNSISLNSGKLSPGGTKTGVIYFKGAVTKVLYSSSIVSNTSATWIVS